MKHSKYIVQLADHERGALETIIKKGRHLSRVFKRAQILLKSADGFADYAIAAQVGMSARTVERTRQRHAQHGLDRALYDAPRSGQPPILDAVAEAKLVAITCSEPPEGRMRWTLELLKERLLTEKIVPHISLQAISEHLRERGIKPWREKNVVRAND